MASHFLTPNPKALARIDHVVVLMLENRSFDNLLGWLYDAEPPPRGQAFDGLHPGLWNPLDNIDADGVPFAEQVFVRKNGQPFTRPHWSRAANAAADFRLPDPDPGEGYKDTNHQLFGRYEVADLYPPDPLNLGFVNNYANAMRYSAYAYGETPTDPRRIMWCYTPEQVPVLSTLARQFAVCDHWHCSVPSQTLPNRDFVHAGTSCGQVNNSPQPHCDAPTIFNRMQDAIAQGRTELSWKVYSGTQRDRKTKKVEHFSLTRLIMTRLHDPALDSNFVPIADFYGNARAGRLPSYSFLEPQFSPPGQNDQHPNADLRPGEQLIADVYSAVRDSPLWEKTLLVITYDEHGGCYDHVPPPGGAAHPDGKDGAPGQFGFRFNRFGVRVPAVLVSPWIEAGTIARPQGWTPFDHTSVLATVCRRFDLEPLTTRDRNAPDLSCVLTRDRVRSDAPEVAPLAWEEDSGGVNHLHRVMAQVLATLTAKDRPAERELIDFIHEAYAAHFHRRKPTATAARGRKGR